jgi:lipopolysaccharide export system protein LptA
MKESVAGETGGKGIDATSAAGGFGLPSAPMRRPPLLVALAAAAFLSATPEATSAPKPPANDGGSAPKTPEDEALSLSADRLDLDVEAKTALLLGHVKLARGPMTMSCPRVDVRYDHVPHVTWARGSGGVVAEIKGVRAEAPDVELDLGARTMELRGGVRLTRGEGWITAERASIDIATARVTMSDVKGSIPLPKPPP